MFPDKKIICSNKETGLWVLKFGNLLTPPPSPENLSAQAVSSSRINLQWEDNSNKESGFKIQRSTNGGQNWFLRDSVGPNIESYSDLRLSPNTIYYYRIFAYNSSGNSGYSNTAHDTTFNLTGIIPLSGIPKEFKLYDNYPNPFNPSTKIKFDIPINPLSNSLERGQGVRLSVYNSNGQTVAILANEKINPGSYEVEWNAAEYPSGIYFYRIISGNFTDSKKMILIK